MSHEQAVETNTNHPFRRALMASVAAIAGFAGVAPNTANAEELPEPPLAPGSEVVLGEAEGVEPNTIAFINLTSIAAKGGGGFAAAFSGEYQGTSTTNAVVAGEPTPNSAMVRTGPKGEIKIRTEGEAQHQIGDLGFSIPESGITDFYDSPVRALDTRTYSPMYNAGDVIKIGFGKERAGRAANLNITVDTARNAGWFALYPCNEGWQGNSTVNVPQGGTKAAFDIVKIDTNGDVCAVGDTDASGLIIDALGFLDVALKAPTRMLDTRKSGEAPLYANQPRVLDFDSENANKLVVARITTTGTVGAGYVSVYPTSEGFNNTSIMNPNGRDDTSAFIMALTDENGRLSIELKDGQSTHLLVDPAGILDPAELGLDPAKLMGAVRIFDSREGRATLPETPPPPPVEEGYKYFDPPVLLNGIPVLRVYYFSNNSCMVSYDYEGTGVSNGSEFFDAPCPL